MHPDDEVEPFYWHDITIHLSSGAELTEEQREALSSAIRTVAHELGFETGTDASGEVTIKSEEW